MDDTHTNTYMFDPESPAELARLINQDQMQTRAMGGPFAGLSTEEVDEFRNVLDLACGPGGWVLDVAFPHPDIEVAGVDISRPMVNYANARAQSQGLTNATFGVMDITQPLDFSDGAFDLVNARYLVGVLKREAWVPLLTEAWRLLRPGGILRLTEPVVFPMTTSPAAEAINRLLHRALWQRGYGFSSEGTTSGDGVSFMLPRLLRQVGYQSVKYMPHTLEISDDAPAWAAFYRNMEVGCLMAKPLLVNTGVTTPEDFDRLYQQMLIEWNTPGFTGLWHFLTAWGYKPAEES
jgi:ubiquinone/menaquinone biosynthesis C-methylase UbiE